jgi:hypothetical protein
MIHLTNKIRSLLHKLEKEGFNGVHFENIELEEQLLEDYIADGFTWEDWKKRQRDYVAFIAQPRLGYNRYMYETASPYEEFVVDATGFNRDFKAFLQKQLGPDVELRYSAGCFEWECYR